MVRRRLGWREERRIVSGFVGAITEDAFPGFSGRQIRMSLMNIMQAIDAVYRNPGISKGNGLPKQLLNLRK
jgi:hypothetical protein